MDGPDGRTAPDEADAADALRVLLDRSIDRFLDRPRALDIDPDAQGWGHVPLAVWLVAMLRPRLVVGIPRDRRAFHAGLCQSLAREGVDGEAIAFAPPGAPDPLERPFAGLARTLALPGPGLAPPLARGSVDLLHADASFWDREAAQWRPALAPGALLVLHGHRPPGSAEPGFDFLHDGGLLLRADRPGPHPVLLLLDRAAGAGGERLAALRARFEWLGERWRQEAIAARARACDDGGAGALLRDSLRERARLDAEVRRIPVLEAERADARRHADLLARRLAGQDDLIRDLLARAPPPPPTAPPPARWPRRRASRPETPPVQPMPPVPEVRPAERQPDPARPRARRVLFVAGEPDPAGAEFRARRPCRAVAAAGHDARWVRIEEVGPDTIRDLDLLVLWRAGWSGHVETMIGLARAAGTRIAYDVDDLIVEPSLARVAVIDAIRTLGVGEDHLARFFAAQARTLAASDLAIATTEELAFALRLLHPACIVMPNGFDDAAHALARLERRARRLAGTDGLLRIGYAAGTRSHQRDFAVAAPAIADVLRARPDTRLVLFRDQRDGDMLLTDEFPALAGLEHRIEWRDTVPVERLGAEIARFDIAICPVETGNPFCEAKSEIKFIESALAEIPCVASPTGPFRRAIEHGVTGLLAGDQAEWRDALLTLVDEPDTRARLGLAAYCDVLSRFGPQRAARDWDSLLRGLDGPAQAAREGELRIARAARPRTAPPPIPLTDTVFETDTLRAAEVTVAITSYNYSNVIEEALASAAAQTIAALELVVTDDGSTDGSLDTILSWARAHAARFTRVHVARTRANAGLGAARNAAFAAAEAPWVMSLDADNRLRPACCAQLLALAQRQGAAFAYPALHRFGDASPPISAAPYDPVRLIPGNTIDAMALVAKWAWAAGGGFYDREDARGWEDYGLWCRLAELGQFGVWDPEELAEYRVHGGSMTNTLTETEDNKRRLVSFFEERHPWLRLRSRQANPR